LSILHLWANWWSLILCFFSFCRHWWMDPTPAWSFWRLLELFLLWIISWWLSCIADLILRNITCL
jgi:hypothetical protein